MTRLRLWHTPSATYMVCIQISGYGWNRVARVWKTHLCSMPTQIKRFTREGQKIKSSAIKSVVLKLQVERKRKNGWCNTDLWQTRNKPGVPTLGKKKNVSESPMMKKLTSVQRTKSRKSGHIRTKSGMLNKTLKGQSREIHSENSLKPIMKCQVRSVETQPLWTASCSRDGGTREITPLTLSGPPLPVTPYIGNYPCVSAP